MTGWLPVTIFAVSDPAQLSVQPGIPNAGVTDRPETDDTFTVTLLLQLLASVTVSV